MRDVRVVPLAEMKFAQRRLVLSLLEAHRAATAKAERDFRRPRDDAALLLVQAVRRATVGLSLPSEEGAESPVAKPNRSRRASGTAIRTDALDGAR